ncbi:methyl-accepting chemotaxis protein [Catenovulum sp. SM1970]|uniref:HAMP domain-containing methyl-accepting chemotaxis protein n=1 Tax=Marinifaba aquimaris TaxID=2741323 RepID=UPI0015736095|nr:methyl-accepting chemotaxis protein [Marinifaba aquimaris]NTS78317.1 methyl-accepting chemotaxis protein [Marinifaba aquimaris]
MRLSAVNKITLGYATVITFLLIVGFSGINSIGTISNSIEKINAQAVPVKNRIATLLEDVAAVNLIMYKHYNATEQAELTSLENQYQDYKKQLISEINQLESQLANLPNASAQIKALDSANQSLKEAFDEIDQTMALSEDALKNFSQLDSFTAELNSVQAKFDHHLESLGAAPVSAAAKKELINAELSIVRGISIAKQMASTQNYSQSRQLTAEFGAWLKEYVEIGFKLKAIPFSGQTKRSVDAFSLSVGDLAYLVARDKGLSDVVNQFLSVKNTLTANLSANQDMLESVHSALKGVSGFASQYSDAVAKDANESVNDSQVMIIIFSVIAIVLGIAVALIAIRNIRSPLDEMNELFSKIATGDLTQTITVDSNDEFGRLKASASQLNTALKEMMAQIRTQADNLANSVDQTSATTRELQTHISDQKEQTDMVVTAMHEMATTIKEVAENAQTTFSEMNTASEHVQNSQDKIAQNNQISFHLAEEMENAASVIRMLDQDVNKIEEILQVIESIASQTNLLALNAAIEAARAGEHGRGFAVVADEVRTLAKRTQDSTEEIKANIETLLEGSNKAVDAIHASQDKTQQAVDMSKEVSSSIDLIADVISTTKNLNLQIATASEEQSATAEEINRNVVQIASLSEQTAEGSSYNERCINDLSVSAHELEDLIKKFKV